MREHRILFSIAIFFFLCNATVFYFLLGGGNLAHTPIPYAVGFIILMVLTSSSLYAEAFVSMYFLRRGQSSQQFFLIAALFVSSFIPSLLLFLRRFQDALSDNMLISFSRIFNFLYVEFVFLLILSVLTINLKSKRYSILFIVFTGFSALLANTAPISFSKAALMHSFFMGGKWLLMGVGFSLCLIILVLYAMALISIAVRKIVVIQHTVFLLMMLVSLHTLLLSYSFPINLLFSTLLVASTFGYLRGIFVNVF